MSCQSSSFISEQLSIYCTLYSVVYLFYNTHNDIMYTIVFTGVPGVSDHEYDCVHWSTWSEWSCMQLCSLEHLEWVIMNTIVFTEGTQSYSWSLTPGTSVNTIVYMITHSRYFSEHNRIILLVVNTNILFNITDVMPILKLYIRTIVDWLYSIDQKNKQRSIKHTKKTKDRVKRTPLKTGVNSGYPEW
jgi:hypothetical protein